MYRLQGGAGQLITPPESPYCENKLPNMCLRTQDLLDRARKDCPTQHVRGISGGLGKTCQLVSAEAAVSASTYSKWDPCYLKTLPVCPVRDEPQPIIEEQPFIETPEEEEEEEEPEDDKTTMYVVGGILALLLAGGVAYGVAKNRKKKRRKK